MYVMNSFGLLDPGNRPQKYYFEKKNQLGGAHLTRFHVLDRAAGGIRKAGEGCRWNGDNNNSRETFSGETEML